GLLDQEGDGGGLVEEAQAAFIDAVGRVDGLIRALAADPALREGFTNSIIGDVRRDVSSLAEGVFRLLADVATLRDNMAAAGIEILSEQGLVRLAAV
ncbi:hypothetical protein, partial [Escherichia coli]|uniref:hypothetical protein n=1 Tax=Escherichia coli TaxID=562 RepID=UPI0028DF7F4B